WAALRAHGARVGALHLRQLFAEDPERFRRFSLPFEDWLFDYSKQRIVPETMELLRALAREAGLERWIERMFSGERINSTENRAVLHVALRNRGDAPIRVDGEDVMPAVERVLERMFAFAVEVRDGRWRGATGEAITDVLNIGIGGSDLGPAMVVEALKARR